METSPWNLFPVLEATHDDDVIQKPTQLQNRELHFRLWKQKVLLFVLWPEHRLNGFIRDKYRVLRAAEQWIQYNDSMRSTLCVSVQTGNRVGSLGAGRHHWTSPVCMANHTNSLAHCSHLSVFIGLTLTLCQSDRHFPKINSQRKVLPCVLLCHVWPSVFWRV